MSVKSEYLDSLAIDLLAARKAAEAASREDDGGTCNFDSATLFPAKPLTEADCAELQKRSGVGLCRTKWMGRVCYWLGFGPFGQGNNNTRTAEAGNRIMRDAGHDCTMYYQMD